MCSPGRDAPFGLEGSDALRFALQAEIVQARFFGRKFALVVVRSLGAQASHLATGGSACARR